MTQDQSHDDTTVRSRCFYDYDLYVGQNVGKSTYTDVTTAVKVAMKGWYDEVSTSTHLSTPLTAAKHQLANQQTQFPVTDYH